MRELVLGSGNAKVKRLHRVEESNRYSNPIKLDIDPNCNPNVLWDLNKHPLPFDAEEFDEIHAYEVLEHLGSQGDWKFFFSEWEEYFRILKPKGLFFGTCPSLSSRWLWGDPGHTRVIAPETLTFLDQSEYKKQIGKTPMTDYRSVYKADFELVYSSDDGSTYSFIMRKK